MKEGPEEAAKRYEIDLRKGSAETKLTFDGNGKFLEKKDKKGKTS